MRLPLRALPVLVCRSRCWQPLAPAAAVPGAATTPGTPRVRGSTDQDFYFVMGDRFANGSTANDEGGLGSDPLVSGFDPHRQGLLQRG